MSFTRIWRTDKDDNVKRNVLENDNNVLENYLNQLTDRQKLIYNRMIETSKSNVLENVLENNRSLAEYFSVNERTIKRDLAELQSKGLIRHKGPDKGGYWKIKVFKK